MHKQGTPQTMQHSPAYQDVVSDVKRFLLARAELCFEAGIDRERIWLDPGIGFGKHLEHNLALLTHLDELVATGLVVLLGVSRKSLIGDLLNRPVDQRLAGSLALVAHAMIKGVGCVRVHDVRETVDLIRMLSAVSSA
jgi:dihydropteroate synthase